MGYLEKYPDYWTQGESETELRENLLAVFRDLRRGIVPHVRCVAELEVA